MASRKYLISLLSRSGRVGGRGRISDAMPQCSQAAVDQCFRPGVLIGNAPGSFSVGSHVCFLGGLRGFTFEFRGLVARPPYLGKDRLVGRSTFFFFFSQYKEVG